MPLLGKIVHAIPVPGKAGSLEFKASQGYTVRPYFYLKKKSLLYAFMMTFPQIPGDWVLTHSGI